MIRVTCKLDSSALERVLLRLVLAAVSAVVVLPGAASGQEPSAVTPLPARTDAAIIERGAAREFTVELAAVPAGKRLVYITKARIDFRQVAGYAQVMRIEVNGNALTREHLINKPMRVKSRSGDLYSMAARDLFSVFYSPDFDSADAHPHYGLTGGIRASTFEFDITNLVREGRNGVVISNGAPAGVPYPLVVGEGGFEVRDAALASLPKRPAPTGDLPRIEPKREHRTVYQAKDVGDGTIEIECEGKTISVRSEFSTPAPAWSYGSNDFFRHERRIEVAAEAVLVTDTFTNLTDENLGIMQRHTADFGANLEGLWLAGLDQPAKQGSRTQPANPTTYATADGVGIGMFPLSDAFRIHARNYSDGASAALADEHLVIPPGASHAAEWAVVPTPSADYWAFINVARRILDVNFEIDGGFAFLRAGPPVAAWTEQQIADFIRFKDAKYYCATIDYPLYNGHYPHGTAFQRIDHSGYIAAFEQRRRLAPGIQNLVYFHCFIDVLEGAPDKFPDSVLLGPDGKQTDYGEPHDKLFVPTTSNSYGPEIAKNIDVILDTIGAEGVYWDEHEYSRHHYHYGDPWDRVSGDIDPSTHKVTRLKSSVTLISEEWRLEQAKRILARGPLIGNGPAMTRARMALKFPCFVETGSITNCTQAHLYSPIALGDHLTEGNELDAYNTMLAALDFGCVYHWYNDVTVVPTHHTLTKYMFPITPVELHEGYIIGKERIITNRSGLFGWGDASNHEVHVFDDQGREALEFGAPQATEGGKTYSEIRIAEGWSAEIVRRP